MVGQFRQFSGSRCNACCNVRAVVTPRTWAPTHPPAEERIVRLHCHHPTQARWQDHRFGISDLRSPPTRQRIDAAPGGRTGPATRPWRAIGQGLHPRRAAGVVREGDQGTDALGTDQVSRPQTSGELRNRQEERPAPVYGGLDRPRRRSPARQPATKATSATVRKAPFIESSMSMAIAIVIG